VNLQEAVELVLAATSISLNNSTRDNLLLRTAGGYGFRVEYITNNSTALIAFAFGWSTLLMLLWSATVIWPFSISSALLRIRRVEHDNMTMTATLFVDMRAEIEIKAKTKIKTLTI